MGIYVEERKLKSAQREVTDKGNCCRFSSCFDCFCLGGAKKHKKNQNLLPDNGVMKWPPWPALSCDSFVLMRRFHFTPRANEAQSQLFNQISWFHIQKDDKQIKQWASVSEQRQQLPGWVDHFVPVWDVHKYLDSDTLLPNPKPNPVLEGERAHHEPNPCPHSRVPPTDFFPSLKNTPAWQCL